MLQYRDFGGVMESETISKNEASSKSQMSRRNEMLRTILFLVFFCVCLSNTQAQDIITLKNGEDIQALVQEIGDVEIKYKKFDNPQGPNYTLKKSEIFTIRYANGSKDVFVDNAVPITTTIPAPVARQSSAQRQEEISLEPLSIQGIDIYNSNGVKLSKNEVRNLMRNIPEALDLFNSGYSRKGTALSFAVLGFIGTASGLVVTLVDYEEMGTLGTCLSAGSLLLFVLPSWCIYSSGNNKIKNSVGVYNRGIKQKYTSDMSLNFGITKSGGMGLTLNF